MKRYIKPEVETVEMKPATLICTSPPITKVNIDYDTEMEEEEEFQ